MSDVKFSCPTRFLKKGFCSSSQFCLVVDIICIGYILKVSWFNLSKLVSDARNFVFHPDSVLLKLRELYITVIIQLIVYALLFENIMVLCLPQFFDERIS